MIPRLIHDRMSGTHIKHQDILLNIKGSSIGRCALVSEELPEGNVSQHVTIIRLLVPEIRDFIHLLLISHLYQQMNMDVRVGVSRAGLSMHRLKLFTMVIPPIGEQRRIAAKVDELMALCDELEASLSTTSSTRWELLEAAIH